MFRKGLVFGIIVLFVGAGVLPSTIGITKEKMVIAKIGNRGYIQDLIDNASDGDTIYIPSGIYYESIIINKSISLVGEDKETTIIDGCGGCNVIGILFTDWVNISGFTIKNATEYISPCVVSIIDCNHTTIMDNIISYGGDGILLSGINNTITGNNISSNFNWGIALDDVHSSPCINNIISGNNISNNWGGILLDPSDNIITGNNITNNNWEGISLFFSSGNIITGNNINLNNGSGIELYSSSNNNITSNNISLNNKKGIHLEDSNDNNITGNNISSNNEHGIQLEISKNNIITNNLFFDDGLFVNQCYYYNIVENNIVNNKPLVYLEDESDYTITDAGQIILINCNNITVENLNLSNTTVGIELCETDKSMIKNNNCSNNNYGIYLDYHSNSNAITCNNIRDNEHGILLRKLCSYNNINYNNFINNEENAYSVEHNSWNTNYWSDYEEKYPNAKKKLFKGIWDTPYEIEGGDNQDNYPLIKPFIKPRTRTITRNMATFNLLFYWLLERFPFLEILFNNMRKYLG